MSSEKREAAAVHRERSVTPAAYERRCVCGLSHRALMALRLKDRHEHRCEVAHSVGFNAHGAEQRAARQQDNAGGG